VESTARKGAGGCARCRSPLAPSLAICPQCGEVVSAALPPAARGGGRRTLLLLLALAGTLGLAVWARLTPPAAACRGGERVVVDWRATDPATPRFRSSSLNQIDPAVTPHVRLAVLRHFGNAIYGDKCDHDFGHNHQAAVDAGHAAGGNAYFHAPARRVGDDQVEVTTTIALAHPGPLPRALRDRYFPGGKVVMINHLLTGGVAERAGLRVNDLLVAIDGHPVPTDDDEAFGALTHVPPDGTLRFDVLRAGEVRAVTMVRHGKDLFGYWRLVAPILDVTP
jgi:hypothetical protein